ncbi:NADPH:quinone oxidoreductase family protein [Zavarzinia sp. CC-PAN008]|uniref:NADPH:quinone oxidoreductase family protein n=1 Tax=Zavarzinia sp. CC-PAN008 TaxID=3243332 RepID=UPI003F7488BC
MTRTTRAIVVRTLDGPGAIRLEDWPLAEPGPGQVQVKLAAASLNFPDYLMTQGKYQLKPELPFVLGMEGAGTVEALGPGVTEVAVGQKVIVGMRHGAFAERVVVPAASLMAVPQVLDLVEAAALPAAYSTAYVALCQRDTLQPGEVLLVHGSSGGVGLAAVELGKLLGATVIATGASDEKLAVVKAKGADHVINLTRDGFREQVKELTGGRGADVIYDPVGGDVFDESVRCIAWGGRILIIGFAGGRIAQLPTNMALIKGFSVVGVRAGEFGRRDPVKGKLGRDAWLALAAEGKLRPHISHRLPLAEAIAGLALLSERKVVGKAVLTMD